MSVPSSRGSQRMPAMTGEVFLTRSRSELPGDLGQKPDTQGSGDATGETSATTNTPDERAGSGLPSGVTVNPNKVSSALRKKVLRSKTAQQVIYMKKNKVFFIT